MAKEIPYEELKVIIETIPGLRERALVAAQYLTASRVSEIRQLQKKDVVDRGEYYSIRLPNLKNKKKTVKEIFIAKGIEAWAVQPFLQWLHACTGDLVFPLGDSRARQLIRQALGKPYASHDLRESRATHLAKIFNFDAFEIQEFLGHARLDTSAIYVKNRPADVLRKMNAVSLG